ncbi:MAG: hypothetical protein JWQ35_1878 [Bacteriovoracaceae bacterium]|nr:hypothetical protein [Bacteriovoracaceae bacterium]
MKFRIFSLSIIILSRLSVSFAADLGELDAALIKERLKRIYGEFSMKAGKEWEVSYQGKTSTWKWSDKSGWACPADSSLKCSEWVPNSFRWWVSSKGWLDNWTPVTRLGFDFGKAKSEVASAPAIAMPEAVADNAVVAAEELEHPVEKIEADPLGGKKWAHEVWQWKNKKDASAKIYVSLRDQKIERIDANDLVEYLEWLDKPGRAPELLRVVLERNGTRVAFAKMK